MSTEKITPDPASTLSNDVARPSKTPKSVGFSPTAANTDGEDEADQFVRAARDGTDWFVSQSQTPPGTPKKTPAPILKQPQSGSWRRPGSTEVDGSYFLQKKTPAPPPLDYFTHLDELRIYKLKFFVTACSPSTTLHSYAVTNKYMQEVFYACEEPSMCNIPSLFCGKQRGLLVHIQNNDRDVLTIRRPFKCCVGSPCCCRGNCPYPAYVSDANDNVLGFMTKIRCCATEFNIFDPKENPLYRIKCPCCRCIGACCQISNWPVTDICNDDNQVANIAKLWSRKYRKSPAFENSYKITFDRELAREHKALMFASVFLLDLMLLDMG